MVHTYFFLIGNVWDKSTSCHYGFALVIIQGRIIQKKPAIFVFGDSLVDVGNNNNFNKSRNNFPHNGIDFPGGIPTGRYSNGYNCIDWIARHVGYEQSPPAYIYVTEGTQMLQGVNFASGGSGILDATGGNEVITFTAQLTNFMNVTNMLEKEVGKENAADLIKDSLFLISAGSNDLFAYYATHIVPDPNNTKQFIADLIDNKFNEVIKVLYKYGVRKFGILGIAQIGCAPATSIFGRCNSRLNSLASDFNSAAKSMMLSLKSELQEMNYSYGNIYDLMSLALDDPELFGFTNVKDACCGSGKFGPCTPNATVCSNRKEYLFWDAVHPTHATSKYMAEVFFNGSTKFASPISLKSMIKL